jgi:hypothetical protein
MFETKRKDGRSYRVVALEFLRKFNPEDTIGYDDLGKELQLHPKKDLNQIQQAVRAANKSLLKVHKRGVKVVTGRGYRMLPAREHMIVANGHQTKADKAMVRCIEFFNGANLSEMTEVERKLHQGQAMLAQAIFASHQHLDRRMKRLEDIIGPSHGGPIVDHEV